MASIKQRPGGPWRARYRDEAGRERSRHFPRKADAQRWLDEVTASIVTGTYADPKAGKISLAAFYKGWSEPQLWTPGTRRAMDLAVKSVTFGDIPMRRIRRGHVERWIKEMSSRGLAPGTIRTRMNNVRAVLRGAVGERAIAVDPSVGVVLPRLRRADAAMTIPTPSQVGAILHSADESFRPFVGLCAFAGLRLGEAAGLQVGDIDFLRRSLAVSRQIQRENGGFEVRAPKFGSERTVFLAPTLISDLAQHVEHRCPGEDVDRWLFRGEGDNPPHQNTIGHRWRLTLTNAGLTGVRLHDLRHFYASGLIAQGCDVVTVQRALGHRSASTTLNTYVHLWPSAEDRTRAAAEGMLGEARRIPTVAATDRS
jgi:integrase